MTARDAEGAGRPKPVELAQWRTNAAHAGDQLIGMYPADLVRLIEALEEARRTIDRLVAARGRTWHEEEEGVSDG